MKQHFIILVLLFVLIISSFQSVQVQGSRKLKERHHYRLFASPKVNVDQQQQIFNVSNSKWFTQNQNKSISSSSSSSSSIDNAMTNQAYSGPSHSGSGH